MQIVQEKIIIIIIMKLPLEESNNDKACLDIGGSGATPSLSLHTPPLRAPNLFIYLFE